MTEETIIFSCDVSEAIEISFVLANNFYLADFVKCFLTLKKGLNSAELHYWILKCENLTLVTASDSLTPLTEISMRTWGTFAISRSAFWKNMETLNSGLVSYLEPSHGGSRFIGRIHIWYLDWSKEMCWECNPTSNQLLVQRQSTVAIDRAAFAKN